MGYIYALVVIGLFFIVLHYFTALTVKQKTGVTLFLALFVLFAYLYNNYSKNEQEKILRVTSDFENGKTLTCNGKKISKENYTLSVGTYTFIGKENTPHFGDMISASSCQ